MMALIAYELKQGVSWYEVTPAVIRYLWQTGEEYARRVDKTLVAFGFWLIENHPAFQVAAEYLPRARRRYAWYLRVPDLPGFLRHIAPVLEQRLADSPFTGYSGEVKLGFYRSGINLKFQRGKLAEMESWQPATRNYGKAAYPGLTFLQLLFGYRSLDELEAAFPDCFLRGRAQAGAARALSPPALRDLDGELEKGLFMAALPTIRIQGYTSVLSLANDMTGVIWADSRPNHSPYPRIRTGFQQSCQGDKTCSRFLNVAQPEEPQHPKPPHPRSSCQPEPLQPVTGGSPTGQAAGDEPTPGTPPSDSQAPVSAQPAGGPAPAAPAAPPCPDCGSPEVTGYSKVEKRAITMFSPETRFGRVLPPAAALVGSDHRSVRARDYWQATCCSTNPPRKTWTPPCCGSTRPTSRWRKRIRTSRPPRRIATQR